MAALDFKTLERQTGAVNAEQHAKLRELFRPHIESFNFMINHGLATAVADIDPREAKDASGRLARFWIEEATIGVPMLSDREQRSVQRRIFPSECRERAVTYKAKLQVVVKCRVGDAPEVQTWTKAIGHVPIMVKSERCNLHGMTPAELVNRHEEAEEQGGYFIINGIERIIRMLVLPRRNYVMAIERSSYKKRGPTYTRFGTTIRCVRPDQTSLTITVHSLVDGNCMLRFSHKKNEYLVPVVLILKALVDTTDREIYERIVQGAVSDSFVTDRVELMLRESVHLGVNSQKDALVFLGSRFRAALDVPSHFTDADVGRQLLRKIVFVHLTSDRDKFNLLVFMVQKLYRLVSGEIAGDNPDSPMNWEILQGGHLYLMYLKDKLEDWLDGLRQVVTTDLRRQADRVSFATPEYLSKAIARNAVDVGRRLEYLMATGNLVTSSGLDLQQVSGYTIVADKLNFLRYVSHFRCIHRGAFFAEMKTTSVRKLLPESWGFICPVHTPDGAPCGLLNHLTYSCELVNDIEDASAVPRLLAELGVAPADLGAMYPPSYLPVMLDGRMVGAVAPEKMRQVADALRYFKTKALEGVPRFLEVGYVPPSSGGLYPGLFLFSTPSRMMRPVQSLATGAVEMIGTFEQVFMDISCADDEIRPGVTTHHELRPTNFLSFVANLTPFSDFNQSPRNMYQCQMGKQTMGTPLHSFVHRTDNKLYRIQTPQTPMFRPRAYDEYEIDNYPTGTNAVVAVISYTGYDMEDAMILNKGSFDRGFGHATVYKTQIADLTKTRGPRGEKPTQRFGVPAAEKPPQGIDPDGFPAIGTKLQPGDPLYCVVDETSGTHRVEKYKGTEPAFVDEIRLLGSDTGDAEAQRAIVKLRTTRNPVIGDKFASRHGQKGVCSQLWPAESMPFTESGMVPDIVFNPHGFPSRMTIGMVIEIMANKGAAMHGLCHDATPFQFSEDNVAGEFFGEQLVKAGYNYYGTERLYSGIHGTEFQADIFFGICYYQRLRHMVGDKFQVRTTGPVHNLTHQPIKGRKRAGGIRFGEMERDSLLAHGVSFMLQDRLMNCSDYSTCYVCRGCGSLLSPMLEKPSAISKRRGVSCRVCKSSKGIEVVAVPYVFRYLVAELTAMNIRLTLDIK